MAYWLVKTEPEECSIEDFAAAPDKSVHWDGVRNYQARNFLRQMAVGDQVLIYHSSCRDIGVAGVVEVVREAYADLAQFDADSPYFDAASKRDDPRWSAVDLRYVCRFPQLLPLADIKAMPELAELPLVKRGNRLSVMPVSAGEWRHINQAATAGL